MPSSPHIQILMATYNGESFLHEQLESIASQHHQNWSLWVSDDGSTDGTKQILQSFAEQHPSHDIRLIEGPQKGAAANFLSLLCHPDLSNQFVAIADQDDIWRPEKLSLALNALKGTKEPTLYGAQSEHISPTNRSIGNSRVHEGKPSFGNALVQTRVSGHSATLNPAALNLVRKIGAVEVPFHDWWICVLITGTGGNVIVANDIVLSYRQHTNNVLGGNQRRFAALGRIFSVFNGRYKCWHQQNLKALEKAHDQLSLEARALLATWNQAPSLGLKRARLLDQLGIVRDRPTGTLLLKIAAFFGRF